MHVPRGPGSALVCTSINEPCHRSTQEALQDEGCLINEEHRSFNQAFVFGLPDDVAGYLQPLGWQVDSRGVATIDEAHKVRRAILCRNQRISISHNYSASARLPRGMLSSLCACWVAGAGRGK